MAVFSSISVKDKKALFYFTIFVIGVLYYFFFFQNQIASINDLKNKNRSLNEKRVLLQQEIAKYNKNEKSIDELKQKYFDLSKKIPNNQDEKFTLVDAKNLSKMADTNLGEVPISQRQNVELQLLNKKKTNKVFAYSLNLNWMLTYDNLKKLLSNSRNYDVIYSIDNISILPTPDGKINTTFEMKFYGFDDKNAPVREWREINLDTGKDNILAAGAGGVVVQSVQNDINTIDKNKDFLVLLSTLNSPTSAITLEKSGKGIDIFGANKPIENVNINISGKDGKYFYSMSTEGENYPQNGQTAEFKPNSDNVVIMVYSQPRKYANDKNKVVINVHNKSDKKVYVYIINEDPKFPRATVVKDGNSIFVYSK
jgi:type IV pilus assembly protein PilO